MLEWFAATTGIELGKLVLEQVLDLSKPVLEGYVQGKSSLLQYLALEWVEGKTEDLPLLIELREFVINLPTNFFEFLHQGRGVDWQFDQQQLHQHLLEFPTLVMFDGLDEVFDRATQSAVIDDIIRFSQQYPKAQVLVTSRIIGYNPDRFKHSGFRHFTIQSLDTDEIHEFIDRWYDLSMGIDPDKVRLKQRLKDAIANHKAIANLADNLLLLTMMAILNRRQELPQDRADLYDQASRVLLYHWDVDYKRVQLPIDAIGRREKQEILHLVAYEMQAGEEGLKGNLIGVDRLTRILTDYLRNQGFSEPREKANRLIQQLRERNFILCYRGADTYGFMHRTFLEYFCAVAIVYRFEKQRTLTFEQLCDEVFGQHWQDENWHEVLRLICGMVDVKFAGELIEYLRMREIDKYQFLDNSLQEIRGTHRGNIETKYLAKEGLTHLLLASDCLEEVKDWRLINSISINFLNALKNEIQIESEWLLGWNASRKIIEAISKNFRKLPETLTWLHERLQEDHNQYIRWAILETLANHWQEDPKTHSVLHKFAQSIEEPNLQQVALMELARGWSEKADTLLLLQTYAQSDKCHFGVRSEAITVLAKNWREEPWLFDFLYDIALKDSFIREHPSNRNPRLRALKAICTYYPIHPKTFGLLRDRAINDSDEQLREWAQEQLEIHDAKIKMEISSND